MATFERFEDIEAWQKARELVKAVYGVTSDGAFARDFGLRDQIRRAVVSVLSNIAEGFERGGDRFPPDFMFRMTKSEKDELVTNCDRLQRLKHSTTLPRVFTEQGVAMLSSALNSDRAVQVNIEIMRAFVRLRRMLDAHKDLSRKLAELEKKYDDQFKIVFEAIAELMTPPEKPKKKIGFEVKEKPVGYGKGAKRKKG